MAGGYFTITITKEFPIKPKRLHVIQWQKLNGTTSGGGDDCNTIIKTVKTDIETQGWLMTEYFCSSFEGL